MHHDGYVGYSLTSLPAKAQYVAGTLAAHRQGMQRTGVE
jgi:hypothetical protein